MSVEYSTEYFGSYAEGTLGLEILSRCHLGNDNVYNIFYGKVQTSIIPNILYHTTIPMYGKYSTRGRVERLIQHEVKPSAVFASRHPRSAVFFIHTGIGGALSVILHFLARSDFL